MDFAKDLSLITYSTITYTKLEVTYTAASLMVCSYHSSHLGTSDLILSAPSVL